LIEDESNFAPDPVQLRLQIGREDARRIWIIGRRPVLAVALLVVTPLVVTPRVVTAGLRGDNQT
jgi:hypothetical protein